MHTRFGSSHLHDSNLVLLAQCITSTCSSRLFLLSTSLSLSHTHTLSVSLSLCLCLCSPPSLPLPPSQSLSLSLSLSYSRTLVFSYSRSLTCSPRFLHLLPLPISPASSPFLHPLVLSPFLFPPKAKAVSVLLEIKIPNSLREGIGYWVF
jgi:hypothetical protein